RDCVGVEGRVDHHGEVVEPLSVSALERLLERLRENGDGEAVVAISYLFSYLNPEHERETAHALREAFPSTAVSVSHEVSPVWREYERATTTIADAYVKPVIEGYVDHVGA